MTIAVSKLAQVYPRLVQHLGANDREYLASALELRRADAGERLITHGEVWGPLLLVAEGDLAISLPSEKGRIDLGRRGAGRWVGELGVIEPGPASATVEAGTDVTLWVLTHEAFEQMRRAAPCAAGRVMEEVSRDVAERLRTLNRVLFRERADGAREVVPAHEAPKGAFHRLLQEVFRRGPTPEGCPPAGSPPAAPAPPPLPAKALTLQALLAGHPAFGRLPAEDREHLEKACVVQDLRDGHVLIREGESRDALYFLLEGQVAVKVQKPREATFATERLMGPGEILGLIAIVDRGPRSATCTARGPVKVATLGLEAVSLLTNTRAPISCAFQYALASQLARDARQLNESLVVAAVRRVGAALVAARGDRFTGRGSASDRPSQAGRAGWPQGPPLRRGVRVPAGRGGPRGRPGGRFTGRGRRRTDPRDGGPGGHKGHPYAEACAFPQVGAALVAARGGRFTGRGRASDGPP